MGTTVLDSIQKKKFLRRSNEKGDAKDWGRMKG